MKSNEINFDYITSKQEFIIMFMDSVFNKKQEFKDAVEDYLKKRRSLNVIPKDKLNSFEDKDKEVLKFSILNYFKLLKKTQF